MYQNKEQRYKQTNAYSRAHEPKVELVYTDSERVLKKYTIKQAIAAAVAILEDRHKGKAVNIKSTYGYPDNALLTLPQLNELQDKIIQDSIWSN